MLQADRMEEMVQRKTTRPLAASMAGAPWDEASKHQDENLFILVTGTNRYGRLSDSSYAEQKFPRRSTTQDPGGFC